MSRVPGAMVLDARRRGAVNSSSYSRTAPQSRWDHWAETRRDGAFRAICFVVLLAHRAYHALRVASRTPSRKASVAATRGLFRGSLMEDARDRQRERRN